MKKYIFSVLMAAMAAFTFSSCEDVPAPYTMPEKPADGGSGDAEGTPTGTGTATDPFNCAAAVQYCKSLESGVESTQDVYVKGKVQSIEEQFSAQYGNCSVTLVDEDTQVTFKVWRAYYFDNKKWTDGGKTINVGDELVFCGKVMNYAGNTPETVQSKAYLYSINGETGSGTPDTPTTGKGSESDPYTVAEAIEVMKAGAPTTEVYLSGIISNVISYNEKYTSITYNISDNGKDENTIQVYSGKGLNGADFSSKDDLKVGQKVLVKGIIKVFVKNETTTIYEVDKTSSIIKIEDGGSTTPDTPSVNDGTEAKPFSVTEVIAKGFDPVTKGVYIKAYIIGSAPGKDFTTLTFTTEGASSTNIGIAASATENNASNCIPVQLPKGDVRDGVSLSTNPGNFKQEIILYGDIDKYFGMVGIKNVTYAKIGDKIYGTKP